MMTNKRELKSLINKVCTDLVGECVATSLYGENPNQEDISVLMVSIVRIQRDYINRVSHPEPGIPARTYYNTLLVEFKEHVIEIVDQLCNMH